jgi:hypothetical protein
MERFVLSRHAAGRFGDAIAIVLLVAIFVFGAPPWVLVPIGMAGASLFAQLRFRAERQLENRAELQWRRPESNRRPWP